MASIPFRLALCGIFLLGAVPVMAAEPKPSPAVPAGAKITLVAERLSFNLGETVRLRFVLTNAGVEPFTFSEGGDYRGSDRSTRFVVTATDAQGRPVPPADPPLMEMGGWGGTTTLAPGKTWSATLLPLRYLKIPGPGVYTVRVTHDLGWPKDSTPHPEGEITLTLTMPDAAQATALVTAEAVALEHPVDGDETPDLSALCWPIYLPPLLHQVDQGNRKFLESIGLINTLEATSALIRLAGGADVETAREAGRLLKRRLPAPPPGIGSAFGYAVSATGAWDPSMVADVRSLGKHLLRSSDPATVAAGAPMITSVGLPMDAPEVLAALDKAMERTAFIPRDDILDDPVPIPQLVQAMSALHVRGYRLGDGLSGSAEILLYFTWLADVPAPRPEDWLQIMDAYARDGDFVIREAALRSIPQPIPPESVPLVLDVLRTEKELGVLMVACDVAGKSGNPVFIAPLLDIIATETDYWVMATANGAADRLGAGYPLLEALAQRLGDEHLYPLALGSLCNVIDGLPGSNSGRTDLTREERLTLRAVWLKFLADHKAELLVGKKFKTDDAALSPDLFGRAIAWQLPDGTRWPAKPVNSSLPYP